MDNFNYNCYRLELINYDKGLLDNIIDAVYVITMENSERIGSVYRQLEKYKLSKNIYIQKNKGYKNCDKKLLKNQTNYDIVDSNYNIWLHAKHKNYNNILILEDDFIFDERILDKHVLNDLDNFINKNDFDIYNLGCFGSIFNPISLFSIFLKHIKIEVYAAMAHSLIISKNIRNELIDKYENDKEKLLSTAFGPHMDAIYIKESSKYYMYYKPLCYQKVEETENMDTWTKSNNKIIKNFLYIRIFFLRLLQLDKKTQPGYDIVYIYNYIETFIFYSLLFYIIYKLWNYCKS